eukprot:CAMPEP_0178824042 /NCGR_PEP_ID=MMETSP0746-20121128/5466_1 /TAXON_ID=913974 /ORGANISM="Nitzschia punctata, Strain CCMP561" /LENGTH=237 /DNA_ID=CAMNT_0020485691 /DNA_START=280 /DNA_END=993 /DNA_ORIENTATION=+
MTQILPLLDLKSLVQFSHTCSGARSVVVTYVEAQKAEFNKLESQVMSLVGCRGIEPEYYTRTNVLKADELVIQAQNQVESWEAEHPWGSLLFGDCSRMVSTIVTRDVHPEVKCWTVLKKDSRLKRRGMSRYALGMLFITFYINPDWTDIEEEERSIVPSDECVDEMIQLVKLYRYDDFRTPWPSHAAILLDSPEKYVAFRKAARQLVWEGGYDQMWMLYDVLTAARQNFKNPLLEDD